jgi:hypothetical protein
LIQHVIANSQDNTNNGHAIPHWYDDTWQEGGHAHDKKRNETTGRQAMGNASVSTSKRKNSSFSMKKYSSSLRAILHGSASWKASKPF